MKSVNFENTQFEKTQVVPSKIICIGRNYVDHIKELGNQLPDKVIPNEIIVFLKPNSAISEQLKAAHQEPLHYEAELCFLYQKEDEHPGKFCAVAIGLDLTKRGLQAKLKAKGLPWERAKAFDGAALFSDFVAIDNIDESLQLELTIDNQVVQAGGVDLMMVKPDAILTELESFLTLENGDIVMTGTPKGVGEIITGSIFSGKVITKNHTGEDDVLVSVKWLAK